MCVAVRLVSFVRGMLVTTMTRYSNSSCYQHSQPKIIFVGNLPEFLGSVVEFETISVLESPVVAVSMVLPPYMDDVITVFASVEERSFWQLSNGINWHMSGLFRHGISTVLLPRTS